MNSKTMKELMKLHSMLIIMLCLVMISCDDDDGIRPPAPINEEELITTMRLELVPEGGSATKVLLFRDLDGEGGNPPVITTDDLDSDTIYNGTITLLNEQESPAEDITEEVEEEGAEHQFFYDYHNLSGQSDLLISYGDLDSYGKPIGIVTSIEATGSGTGHLKVTLRHEPNKTAANVEAGDITNAGGETDIEVTFDITVQ